MIDSSNFGQVTIVNFASDLPPLINDLEQVCELPETSNLEELQENLLHQQEVLLKVKDYLVYLYDQQGEGVDGSSTMIGGDAGAIAEAVIQELQLKKTEWVAPISQELDQLTAKKQILEREIYRLNQQYQTVLGEFPQQLVGQFQGLLQTQLSKAVELFEQRLRYISSVTHPMNGLEDAGFASSEAQTEPGRSPNEKVEAVQQNLDKSLANLDSTIQAVFTSLQEDIAAYQGSVTDDLRRLHGIPQPKPPIDYTPEDSVVESEKKSLEPVAIPEPEPPELKSLIELPVEEEELAEVETPAVKTLFADDAFDFQAEEEEEPTNSQPTEEDQVVTTDIEDQPNSPEPKNDLNFAASLVEEGLFGDGEAIATEEEESDSAIPAESFLFGDPVEQPVVEESKVVDLKTVIATPSVTETIETPATSQTTVKTINLLTELLENGELNAQEVEDESDDDGAMDNGDPLASGTTEDLNPDLDNEGLESPPLTVSVLDPEQMEKLAADLNDFGTSAENTDSASSETVDVEVTESSTVIDLWGDGESSQESE